jgi:hypothetical protein
MGINNKSFVANISNSMNGGLAMPAWLGQISRSAALALRPAEVGSGAGAGPAPSMAKHYLLD